MVQWLRPFAPNAGGPGLIPGWGTRSHVLQLRTSAVKAKKKKARFQFEVISDSEKKIPYCHAALFYFLNIL